MKTVLTALALMLAVPAVGHAAEQAGTARKDCCEKTADGKANACCEKKADGSHADCCAKHAAAKGAGDPHAGHDMGMHSNHHAGHGKDKASDPQADHSMNHQ